MTRSTKTTNNKWRIFIGMTVVVCMTLLALNVITIVASYPTESHKNVARNIDTLNMGTLNGQDYTTVIDSPEYKALIATPEQQYSAAASVVFLIVNVVVNIAIIGGVYTYIRKHRVTNKAVVATVAIVTIGGLLPLVLAGYINAAYLGTAGPQMASMVFILFIGLVVTPVVVALIARIFEWSYNRKHSFIVE